MLSKSGIYQIRNMVNGKVYVGSSIDIPRRWRQHRRELRNGVHIAQHLQRAWTKYGEENFRFEVLHHCPKADVLLHEQRFLDELMPAYNFRKTAASNVGMTMPKEFCDAIRFNPTVPRYDFAGKRLTLYEWAKEVNIPHSTLWQRIFKYGWELGRALTTPKYAAQKCSKRTHKFIYQGEERTIAQLSALSGIAHDTLHSRLVIQGWGVDKAMTTSIEEAKNTRKHMRRYEHDGEALTLTEWAARAGISPTTLHYRLHKFLWSMERAITTPPRKQGPVNG